MSFVKRGLVSDGGGMYFLPRRVGLPRAKELIFTGRGVDANEALGIGLVDRVVSSETLIADAKAWARELGQGSRTAIALSKAILDRTFETAEEQEHIVSFQSILPNLPALKAAYAPIGVAVRTLSARQDGDFSKGFLVAPTATAPIFLACSIVPNIT